MDMTANTALDVGPATRHPKYREWDRDYWRKLEKVLSGPAAVKAARTLFLPMPNADDQSEANKARYDAYVKRAIFLATTRRTLQGYIGLVFYKDPETTLPPAYTGLITNADGNGTGLVSQSKAMIWDSFGYARAGLAVDYSATEQTNVRESAKSRVEFQYYGAKQIINWREGPTPQGYGLTLVVIEEDYVIQDDGYGTETKKQQKEWRLVEGQLVVKIWREDKTRPYQTFSPRKANNTPFDYIPFIFHGPNQNNPTMQEPPLADMAEVNIGHFRNSADHEESTFVVGQPTYLITGLTENWVNNHLDGKLRIGSRAIIPLPRDADGKILQPEPNTMASEGMRRKEEQMSSLGAKNLVSRSVERTASEAGTDHIVDNSVLGIIISNVNAVYARAFQMAADYTGVTLGEEEGFELNTDYEARHMTPQEQQQLVANWQAGLMSREEVRWNFRRSGVAYQEDDAALTSVKKDEDLRIPKTEKDTGVKGDGPGAVTKFQ